jgi:hypothetical protein
MARGCRSTSDLKGTQDVSETRQWDRRDMLGGIALLALALGVPAGVVSLTGLPDDDLPTDRQRRMIAVASQHVLPRTRTPGAGDVGVGDFVILALAHGLDGTRAPAASAGTPQVARYQRHDGSLRFLEWLEDSLDIRGLGDWLARPPAEQSAALARLDAEAYTQGADKHPWRAIKSLILTGYYTSQVGGARELRYVLDPGRYDPDLPLPPHLPALSSDWSAVDFG